MGAIIHTLWEALNTSVFLLTVILAVCFWLVYKVSTFLGERKAKDQHHDSDIARMSSKIDSMSGDLAYVKERTNLIYQVVFSGSMVKSDSPISLTENGRAFARTVSAKEIVSRNKAALVELVGDEFNNAYDLQQACFALTDRRQNDLLHVIGPDAAGMAKDAAFKNGAALDNVLMVFAVLLRDMLLLDRGWSGADVDRHDPKQQENEQGGYER